MQNLKSAIPKKIVLIGASTGGPGQLQKIVASLPVLKNCSLVIAQHMVDGFFESFSSTLQKNTTNNIQIIDDNTPLEKATIYLCEGATYLDNKKLKFHKKGSSHDGYNPDINTIFNSFVSLSKDSEILCVILTGIGSDGVEACTNLSNSGVTCLTESKNSAIVDGMPNRARALVPNIIVNDIDTIIQTISKFCDV